MKLKFKILLLLVILLISGCNQTDKTVVVEESVVEVSVQKASASRSAKNNLDYPGLVAAENEAKIIAKTSGTIAWSKIKTGDKVNLGDQLFKIDDINKTGDSFGANNTFNSSQVKQAQVMAEQARASYELARTNYNNLVISSTKDLNQANISRNQAITGEGNIGVTTNEAYKSAKLAYDTAKIATEQAKLSLENRQKQSNQSSQDTRDNASVTAESTANTCGVIITAINNMTAFDETTSVSIAYDMNLGAQDTSVKNLSKQAYLEAKSEYQVYQINNLSTIDDKVAAAQKLAVKTKKLIDNVKLMFDKTITSINLPQSSATGTSLSGLQSTVAGYQTQVNGLLSQLNATKQALTNTDLNNTTTLDSLTKAYELAQQQEAVAAQNLKNLQAGNISQQDQANFSAQAAKNQYDSIKIKLDAQISTARSQVEIAQAQYQSALLNLQAMYDNHQVISPIAGVVSRKLVNEGETVSAGQLLAVVSQPDSVKVQFYVDQANLSDIKPGLIAQIKDSDGKFSEAAITSVSPQADASTKRFLVEARPIKPLDFKINLGSVINVLLTINRDITNQANTIILPISAVEIGQNNSSIFVVVANKAKKIIVELGQVYGEFVEVKAELKPDDLIVIEGNKYLQDNDKVKIK